MDQATELEGKERRLRIDKFVVPEDALEEFVAKMKYLQETLGSLPGCERATVLRQVGGPGKFNVLTFVQWKDQASVTNAVEVMERKFRNEGFDPRAFTERLRIQPDLGLYTLA